MYSHSFLSCLSTQWFDSLIRFVGSIHWFDSLLPFIDSIHSFDALIRFIVQVNRAPFKEIVKVKTWTKINQQNIFLEGHFKTIGKWVQKRQTLIFTVAKFLHVVFYVLFWLLMVKPDEFSKGPGTPGPAGRSGRCTLCVCFLGDPSLMPHENPKK